MVAKREQMSDPTEKNDQVSQNDELTDETVAPVEPVTAEAIAAEEPVTIDAETVASDEDPVIDTETVAAEGDVVVEAANSAAPARRRGREPRQPRELRPLGRYAVVKTGGKQYRVSVGDTISVERLATEAGNDVTLDEVLLVGGDGATKIGTPLVDGASVSATIDDHFRGEKIVVFKYKAKKRYRRRTGHRQEQTRLTITAING
jgi:large subunit ribosomal protein L21